MCLKNHASDSLKIDGTFGGISLTIFPQPYMA